MRIDASELLGDWTSGPRYTLGIVVNFRDEYVPFSLCVNDSSGARTFGGTTYDGVEVRHLGTFDSRYVAVEWEDPAQWDEGKTIGCVWLMGPNQDPTSFLDDSYNTDLNDFDFMFFPFPEDPICLGPSVGYGVVTPNPVVLRPITVEE